MHVLWVWQLCDDMYIITVSHGVGHCPKHPTPVPHLLVPPRPAPGNHLGDCAFGVASEGPAILRGRWIFSYVVFWEFYSFTFYIWVYDRSQTSGTGSPTPGCCRCTSAGQTAASGPVCVPPSPLLGAGIPVSRAQTSGCLALASAPWAPRQLAGSCALAVERQALNQAEAGRRVAHAKPHSHDPTRVPASFIPSWGPPPDRPPAGPQVYGSQDSGSVTHRAPGGGHTLLGSLSPGL